MLCQMCAVQKIDSYRSVRKITLACFDLDLCWEHWQKLDEDLEGCTAYNGWMEAVHQKDYMRSAIFGGRTDVAFGDQYLNRCKSEHDLQMQLRSWIRQWVKDNMEPIEEAKKEAE